MAIYHLSVKVIARSQGRSAVASAAYRAADKILNDYDGVMHDYTKKGWVEYSEIMLPQNAPEAYHNRATLWNAVEASEKNKTAQLAREVEIALPKELTIEQQIKVVREYVQLNFVNAGMCADFSIHNPPLRDDKNRPIDENGNIVKNDKDYVFPNPHVHIMLTMRPMDEDGTWEKKSETEYLCVRDGIEVGMTGEEFKVQKTEGWRKQYQYQMGNKKVWLTDEEGEKQGLKRVSRTPRQSRYGRKNPTVERWNSKEQVLEWRQNWETNCNQALLAAGKIERIDSRSFVQQGRETMPTIHLGIEASQIEKRADRMQREGIMQRRSELGEVNKKIKHYNSLIWKLKAAVELYKEKTQEKIMALRNEWIVVEYHIEKLASGLSAKKKERYHLLEDYLLKSQKYQRKKEVFDEEYEQIVQEAKKVSLFELKKRRELQAAQLNNQKNKTMIQDLQTKLLKEYGMQGKSMTSIEKEYEQLSYIPKYELLEHKAKAERNDIRQKIKKAFKELEPIINIPYEENTTAEEVLKSEYKRDYNAEIFSSAVKRVDKEIAKVEMNCDIKKKTVKELRIN